MSTSIGVDALYTITGALVRHSKKTPRKQISHVSTSEMQCKTMRNDSEFEILNVTELYKKNAHRRLTVPKEKLKYI